MRRTRSGGLEASGLRRGRFAVVVVAVALTAVLALGVGGCRSVLGASGCTDVGGTNGVGVGLGQALFVHSGSVAMRVCDGDDCGRHVYRLGQLPDPVGRGVVAEFDDLDLDVEGSDSVQVSVFLRDEHHRLVARARDRAVDLEETYPNGRRCDEKPYTGGGLRLTRSDSVEDLRR